MSMLLDERPLIIISKLACAVGVNEAIVLQQVNYWLKRVDNHRDGKNWVYNSIANWQKQFPFFSVTTVKRTFTSLERKNLLIVGNYNKAKFDKTKWYTINFEELDRLEKTVNQRLGQSDPTKGSTCTNGDGQSDPTNTRDYTETSRHETTLSPVVEKKREKTSQRQSKLSKSIGKWTKQTNQPLVDYAVGIAKERAYDKRNELSYFESVMNDWTNNGIKTVKEAKQYVDNKQSNYSYHVRKAFEPAWLDKQDVPIVDDVDEAKRKALRARIKKMKESHKS